MWELDYKESWAWKNWCFWTVVLEKTPESPLDCKEIQPVHPKGDQSWVFIGRTDVEAETPILWPPDEKSRLIWKDSDAGEDWRREEKGMTEDETVGWHQTRWTWVWVNSGSFWWTERLDVLQSMGSERVGHGWATKLNWLHLNSRLALTPARISSLTAFPEDFGLVSPHNCISQFLKIKEISFSIPLSVT